MTDQLIRIRPLHEADPAASVLDGYVSNTQLWQRVPVRLSKRLTRSLWVLIGTDIGVALWMLAVLDGRVPCDRFLCTISTLGGNAALLGLVATGSALLLVVLLPFTAGLTRADSRSIIVAWFAAIGSVVSAIGLVTAALIALLAIGLIFLVVATIGSNA